MGMNRLAKGMERLIKLDGDAGTVTRQVKTVNERGQPVPSSDTASHKLFCRVSYQSSDAWPARQWEGGLTVDTSPYALARFDANLEQGDILEWRGRRYTVGVVTRPNNTCTQAPLTEVK